MYEDNTHNTKLSHTFIPVENFNQFVINHQKGEIVSASGATPSWFWSIDDKLTYPLARNVRLPHRANTEATASTVAQRPRKRS